MLRAGTVNVTGDCGSTDSAIVAGGPNPNGLCAGIDADDGDDGPAQLAACVDIFLKTAVFNAQAI